MPLVTYSKDPDKLRCWVCGAIVSDPANVGWKRTHPPEIMAEKPKWEAAWKKFRKTHNPLKDSFALQLPASEIDAAAFRPDDAWLPLCRLSRLGISIHRAALLTIAYLVLIYKDENNRPSRYQISGIAYIPGAKRDKRFIIVPEDSQRAYIGSPEPIMSQCLRVTPVAHPFDPSTVKSGDLEGYLIHSRCWTLVQKELGNKGEVRLDILIKTLRCRWEELVPYLMKYIPKVREGDSAGLIGKNINHDYKRLTLGSGEAGVYPWPESDAIHIYELRTVIAKSYDSRRKQRMIRPSQPVNLLSTKYGIPLEVMYLITEYLDINELEIW